MASLILGDRGKRLNTKPQNFTKNTKRRAKNISPLHIINISLS